MPKAYMSLVRRASLFLEAFGLIFQPNREAHP